MGSSENLRVQQLASVLHGFPSELVRSVPLGVAVIILLMPCPRQHSISTNPMPLPVSARAIRCGAILGALPVPTRMEAAFPGLVV